jgi:ABC-2 type transport system permease protein
MKRLRHLFRKELIELGRDPRLFGIVIIAPIVQLTLLAYAATTDVRDVPVIVMDEDGSSQSRDLVERFDASANFTIVGAATSPLQVQNALDTRAAWMALTIPHDYGERVREGSPTTVQVVADGTDANSTNVALGYAGALVSAYAAELAASSGRGTPGAAISAEVRVWFNPQLESRFFMIPGIALVLVVSIYWFEVPLRGSLALLFGMCGIYLLSTLGLGLFVSTISRTQQQAMMTASFFFMIPMVFLSGFVFPIENMPDIVQPVTYLVPLRYFLIILRGIFLKGVGLETLWPQALALLAWGTVVLTLATLRSSKRLG